MAPKSKVSKVKPKSAEYKPSQQSTNQVSKVQAKSAEYKPIQ